MKVLPDVGKFLPPLLQVHWFSFAMEKHVGLTGIPENHFPEEILQHFFGNFLLLPVILWFQIGKCQAGSWDCRNILLEKHNRTNQPLSRGAEKHRKAHISDYNQDKPGGICIMGERTRTSMMKLAQFEEPMGELWVDISLEVSTMVFLLWVWRCPSLRVQSQTSAFLT